jgi:hypothetical protein
LESKATEKLEKNLPGRLNRFKYSTYSNKNFFLTGLHVTQIATFFAVLVFFVGSAGGSTASKQ